MKRRNLFRNGCLWIFARWKYWIMNEKGASHRNVACIFGWEQPINTKWLQKRLFSRNWFMFKWRWWGSGLRLHYCMWRWNSSRQNEKNRVKWEHGFWKRIYWWILHVWSLFTECGWSCLCRRWVEYKQVCSFTVDKDNIIQICDDEYFFEDGIVGLL